MANIPFLNNAYFAGKVGIGTASPSDKLHVFDTAVVVKIEGNGVTSANLKFKTNETDRWNLNVPSGSTDLRFTTGSSDTLTLKSSGNVGIGTTSPSQKLDVNGAVLAGDYRGSNQVYLTSPDNWIFRSTTGNERMRITSAGNVGIGTTSPSAKLEIAGAGNQKLLINRTDGDNFFIDAQNGQIRMRGSDPIYMGVSGDLLAITNTNVGIGTTSPTEKLEVVGNIRIDSTSAAQLFLDSAAGNDSVINFQEGATQKAKIGYDNSLSGFAMVTGSGPYSTADMVILDSGNVGIGTTSPSQKLQVSGNSLVTGTQFIGDTFTKIQQAGGNLLLTNQSSSGAIRFLTNSTERVRIDSSGNVGIGTTSPSQKLEVTGGNVKADEYLYNATDRTSSKNWKFLAAVNAGTYRELGSWRATEGNVVLRITVQSKTSGNSGTAVYMFQGGFNQAADGWYELVPAFKGGGHGNAQDGWKVLWYESTSYTFKIAVAVPTGLNNKNLNVSVEFLGDTEGDSYYQYNALTTTGTIPTYSLERTTSYSNRNLVSSDSITAQYDATNYTVLGYDYLDTYGGSQLFKVAGTERLRITSTGNVGIGTTSPGDKLEIGNLSNYTGLTVKGAGASRPAVTFKNATQSLLGAIYGTEGRDVIIETGGNGTTGTVALTLSSAGALKLNTYTAGTLVSDASGNITVSSGGGAGGPYLPLAGGTMTGTAGVIFPDNFNLNLGTSGDFRIFYNGNNAILQNTGGDIIFENTANDRDIFFKSDDGIGGVTTYFQLDGSQTQTVFYQNAQFQTNARLKLGNSGNLQMYHTSGISFIENNTGPLYIKNNANDQDIILQSDNGSGGVENYIQIDGSEGRTLFNKTIRLNDAAILQIGNDADLRLYHNGTNSNIENFTGTLQIIQNLDDGDISFKSDNGSGGTTEYFRLDGGSTMNVFSKPTWHGDGVKSFYGNSQDLQIFHDGSNSYVSDTGTGSLILTGTDLQLKSAGDEFFMYGAADGQVALYHNGTKKFETGGTGVTVIGSATATTFLGDLNGTINTATTAVTKANATNDTTVATTAFVQNLIGTIPAGLVFQGTWNAATNTPTLTSGSGTTGHFYIVSTDGSTNLDGITDWKVGDWAVFVEQGASDQWEKVDNSSVLDGSGTGGSVAGWAGSGTSNTLTNAPITFSGNNTTFAGSVTGTNATFTAGTAASGTPLTLGSSTQTSYTLQQFQTSAHSSTNAYLIAYGAGHGSQAGNFAMKNIVSSGEIFFELASGVEPLRMTSTGSTFAGALTIPDYIYHTGDANTKFGFGGNDSFQVNTSGAVAFSIDTAGAATFAGNVGVGMAPDSAVALTVSGQIGPTNGTAAAPTHTFYSDDDTGMYRSAANALSFSTSGTLALTLDSSQNATFAGSALVNGTNVTVANESNPYVYLNDTNAGAAIFQQEGNTTRIGSDSNTQVVLVQNNATAVTIGTNKNVGIGDTSPTSISANTFSLSVNSSRTDLSGALVSKANGTVKHQQYWDSTGYGFNLSANSGNFKFTGGNVGIGTTNPGSLLHLSSSTGPRITLTDTDASIGVDSVIADISFVGTEIGGETSRIASVSETEGGEAGLRFYTGASVAQALKLDKDQNATFAGDINIGTGKSIYFSSTTGLRLVHDGSNGNVINSTGDLKITNGATDKDIIFRIKDGASSLEAMRVDGSSNQVGIGTTSPTYKLSVSGGIEAGGLVTYSKSAGSLDTTGYAVAGLTTGYNGNSAGFTFTCFGNTGGYQKVVYSCYNGAGTWYSKKVIDEGTNDFDVEASANGSTITFTFKSTSGTKNYTPRVTIEATGHSINSTYA